MNLSKTGDSFKSKKEVLFMDMKESEFINQIYADLEARMSRTGLLIWDEPINEQLVKRERRARRKKLSCSPGLREQLEVGYIQQYTSPSNDDMFDMYEEMRISSYDFFNPYRSRMTNYKLKAAAQRISNEELWFRPKVYRKLTSDLKEMHTYEPLSKRLRNNALSFGRPLNR